MSRTSLLAITIVSLVVSVAAAFLAVPKQPEGLYASPAAADLGELSQQQRLTTAFTLKNGFSRPITIDAIAKTCGCTEFELQRNSLRPEEQTGLKATFYTGRARGHITANLTVFFHHEGGQREWITLPMGADVVPEIDCEPSTLVFRPNHGETKEVRLSSKSGKPFLAKRANCDHAAFEARLLSDRNAIQITFDPSRWSPDLGEARLLIDTSRATEPTIRVPLRVDHHD
jgi:hypothetical protein